MRQLANGSLVERRPRSAWPSRGPSPPRRPRAGSRGRAARPRGIDRDQRRRDSAGRLRRTPARSSAAGRVGSRAGPGARPGRCRRRRVLRAARRTALTAATGEPPEQPAHQHHAPIGEERHRRRPPAAAPARSFRARARSGCARRRAAPACGPSASGRLRRARRCPRRTGCRRSRRASSRRNRIRRIAEKGLSIAELVEPVFLRDGELDAEATPGRTAIAAGDGDVVEKPGPDVVEAEQRWRRGVERIEHLDVPAAASHATTRERGSPSTSGWGAGHDRRSRSTGTPVCAPASRFRKPRSGASRRFGSVLSRRAPATRRTPDSSPGARRRRAYAPSSSCSTIGSKRRGISPEQRRGGALGQRGQQLRVEPVLVRDLGQVVGVADERFAEQSLRVELPGAQRGDQCVEPREAKLVARDERRAATSRPKRSDA